MKILRYTYIWILVIIGVMLIQDIYNNQEPSLWLLIVILGIKMITSLSLLGLYYYLMSYISLSGKFIPSWVSNSVLFNYLLGSAQDEIDEKILTKVETKTNKYFNPERTWIGLGLTSLVLFASTMITFNIYPNLVIFFTVIVILYIIDTVKTTLSKVV